MRLYCPFTREEIILPHNKIEVKLYNEATVTISFDPGKYYYNTNEAEGVIISTNDRDLVLKVISANNIRVGSI